MTNIRDTFDFVTRILSSEPGPNHMVSFDVKSLFTTIPIDFVINQILEKSFSDIKFSVSVRKFNVPAINVHAKFYHKLVNFNSDQTKNHRQLDT